MIQQNIVSLETLKEDLNNHIRDINTRTLSMQFDFLSEEEEKKLEERYKMVIERLNKYAEQADGEGKTIDVQWVSFRQAGYQLIAEGWINDLTKPVENSYNFHGQNTSQWVYAFGFMFDVRDRDFSIHT